MILEGEEAMLGMMHFMSDREPGCERLAIFVDDMRYGGFRSRAHAMFEELLFRRQHPNAHVVLETLAADHPDVVLTLNARARAKSGTA